MKLFLVSVILSIGVQGNLGNSEDVIDTALTLGATQMKMYLDEASLTDALKNASKPTYYFIHLY